MRKTVLAAAIFAAASLQGASAADRHCYSAADLEAEQAIKFQTNLMVISSACRDTRVRRVSRAQHSRDHPLPENHDRLISDVRARATPRATFDAWNTSLANEISLRQGAESTASICQKAADLLKMASTLDAKGLHDYAVAQATSPAETHPRCGR